MFSIVIYFCSSQNTLCPKKSILWQEDSGWKYLTGQRSESNSSVRKLQLHIFKGGFFWREKKNSQRKTTITLIRIASPFTWEKKSIFCWGWSSGPRVLKIGYRAQTNLLRCKNLVNIATRVYSRAQYRHYIGIMVRVFANGQGDLGLTPGRVITKTQKNGTWCYLA